MIERDLFATDRIDAADRATPARSPRGTRHPALAVGWLAVATIIVLGRRGASATRDASPPPLVAPRGAVALVPPTTTDTVARHAPVTVLSEWWHDPVEVLATPADSTAGADAAWRDRLPKPFAVLRKFVSPLIMPRLSLPRALTPDFPALRALAARARPGQPVNVTLTAYCLHGTTRTGSATRSGIVAADPRIFPMARHVELFAAGRYLGRFRVEDTGGAVHGTHLDIWTPDCADAERFGTRPGIASLVALGD
ncbi:MAG TPA: 3D domain-containing protein [Gemmatirosa sp.]